MMRILLLTIGTRGDVEPFCALALELLQRGIDVEFFLESKWVCLAEAINSQQQQRQEGLLTIHALPFDNAAFFRRANNNNNISNNNQKQKQQQHPQNDDDDDDDDVDDKTRSSYLENLVRIQREYLWPTYPMIHPIAKKCQRIVSNSFATYLICHLSKTIGIPASLLHLQPLLPNQIFPSYRLSQSAFVSSIVRYFDSTKTRRGGGGSNQFGVVEEGGGDGGGDVEFHPEYQFEVNPDLYLALLEDGIITMMTKNQTQTQTSTTADDGSSSPHKEAGSLPFEWEEMRKILAGYHPQFTIVNAYNHYIIPPLRGTPGLGANILDIGSLADNYIHPTFVVPTKLRKFLDRQHHFTHNNNTSNSSNNNNNSKHHRPICIGFGSMPLRRKQVEMVMETVHYLVRKEKQPVILVGDALLQDPPSQAPSANCSRMTAHDYDNDLVLHLSSIPYPYLLPCCSLMICHGGAGVLQAALRAGCPCLICPIVGDQFALAALMEGLNYGRQVLWVQGNRIVIDESIISYHDMIREIHNIQSSKQIQDNCQQISEKIKQQQQQQQQDSATAALGDGGGSAAAKLADFVVGHQ